MKLDPPDFRVPPPRKKTNWIQISMVAAVVAVCGAASAMLGPQFAGKFVGGLVAALLVGVIWNATVGRMEAKADNYASTHVDNDYEHLQ